MKRTAAILSSATALVLAAVTLYDGPTVIDAPTDVFILLGGAWRMMMGQVPHVDFENPIGVVTYSLVEAGMVLGGPNAGAPAIACVLFLLPAAAWTTWIAYRRFPPWVAFGIVVWISVLSVATRPLGYDPHDHTYAMLYNRFGWIALGLLALQAFLPPRREARQAILAEAVSLGLLAGVLVYTKINFAVFGLAVLGPALLARPDLRSLRTLGAAAGGALVVCIGLWLATGVDPMSYLGDLIEAVASQSAADLAARIKFAVKTGLLPLGLMSIAVFAFIGRRAVRAGGLRGEDALLAAALGVPCAAAIMITATNTGERGEVPLFAFIGLILLANVERSERDWFKPVVQAGLLASVLISVLVIGGRDLWSIWDSAAWRRYRISDAEAAQRFDAPPLRDHFVIPASSTYLTQYWRAKDMPARLNEAFALLRRHVTAESRVFSVAITDEFSFALGLTPPRGGPLWWERHLSYDPGAPPPAEEVFADVTLIIIPVLGGEDLGCCRDPLEDIPTMYADYFADRFDEIDESRHWRLLARKTAPSERGAL